MTLPSATTSVPANPLAVDEGIRPNVGLLVGWFLVHTIVWIGLVALIPGDDGIAYTDLGALGTPWVRQFIIPLSVVVLLQLVGIRRLGWWRSVLREPARSNRRWMWIPAVLILVVALATLASDGFAVDAGASYLVGCAVTMLLVGTTEELTFRGVLQVGGRRVVGREWQAVVFASVLFGLFHTPNIVIGADVSDALRQTVATAVIGTAFYALRRASGSLIPCIVLHAAYDFMLIQGGWDSLLSIG